MTQRQLIPKHSRQLAQVTINTKNYVDFSSNDYLGLSQSTPDITVSQWGSTGSRLLSGDHELFHQLEHRLAKLTNREAALCFNSGYHANSGIIPALFSKNDIIFADKLSHASLLDGIQLSGAKLYRYKHKDYEHLASLLIQHRKHYKKALILSESIFSMDGDTADISALSALKAAFNCELMIDDAHGFGILGKDGLEIAKNKDIDYYVATFGKAFGSYGAFIGCSLATKETLIHSCRSFLYSTALPIPIAEHNLNVLNTLPTLNDKRHHLKELWAYAHDHFTNLGIPTTSQSMILPIIIEDTNTLLSLKQLLKEKGFWCVSIFHPTVPKGKERLRLSLTIHHTKEQLDELFTHISKHLAKT